MFKNHQLLRQLALFVVLIVITGTIGYTLVEDGWSYFDGFYMTLITLTTIGFSEVHELSTAGRWLTVFIVIFGLGAAATILSQLAQLMLDGNLAANWRQRRMDKKVAQLTDHVVICGFGRIGQAIAADLTAMGVSCVIIDRDDGRNQGARDEHLLTIAGNATSDATLLHAGIERAAVLVAALSNDSDNLFVALAARDLNRDLVVIARGEDRSIETRMLRAGVDRVVYPAQLGGGQIARLVSSELGHEVDQERFRRVTDVMGFDLQVYRNFKKRGVTVGELLESTGAVQVVAHIDADGHRHPLPAADHLVGEDEAVLLLAEVGASRDSADDATETAASTEPVAS
jgi:voltage-gated potassium channel